MRSRIPNTTRQSIPEPNLRESRAAKKMAKEYPELAIRKMNELADQGSLKSLLDLGQIYLAGKAVPKDWSLSETYFRRAADRGSYYAYTALGVLYLKQEHFEKAYDALSAAARKGYPPALTILGQLYYLGTGGLGQDRGIAKQLLQKAAERGSLRARVLMGRILMSDGEKPSDALKGFLLIAGAIAQAIIVMMVEGFSSDRLK